MQMPLRLRTKKERDKIVVVAEKRATETAQKLNEAAQKLNQFWYEAGQAVVQSTFEVQGRSLTYVQDTLKDGIETLRSNIEDSEHWFQRANKPNTQQEPVPSILESGVEAYKRNMAFLQRAFEHGIDTFRGNAEIMRDLTQTLIKKAQEQQQAFWS